MWRLLTALTLALVLAAGPVLASGVDEQMEKAKAAVAKAEAATKSTVRDENYKTALQTYGKIAGNSRYQGTPEAAEALYAMAMVQKTAKGKTRNLYASHETLKHLVNIYDKPERVLAENLTEPEVRQVRAIAADAKALKSQVDTALDKQNSKKIIYKVMDFLVLLTGRVPGFSYWFAIVLMTVLIKIIITPLTKMQFKAMKEMQKVAPLVKEIQQKYKGEQKIIGEKTMDLYKEHHINPFASCLPLLIQMPILILLYRTIQSYEFQFAKGTFLWIGSGLSHMTSFPVGFFGGGGNLVWVTARNLSEPDLILVLLYVVSMYVSTKLSAVDPTQAEQQKMMAIVMPIMFAFIFASFPSAFLLYWLVFNILQTSQQYLILRGPQAVPAVPGPPPKPEETPAEERSARVRRRKKK